MSNGTLFGDKSTLNGIKGVIFDFDGTLLDIKKVVRKSIVEVFNENTIYADMNETSQEIGAILESVQGYPLPKILLQSHEIFGYVSALEHIGYLKKLKIATKIFAKYQQYSKEAHIFPAAKIILEKLRETYDLFVVSHNKTETVVEHLKKENLEKYFKGVYGADKIPALKPDPEAFRPVFQHYPETKSMNFIAIGDMPTDIQAGKEAGFYTVAVTSGVSKKELLSLQSPDLMVDSLDDLLKYIEGEKNQDLNSNAVNAVKINT